MQEFLDEDETDIRWKVVVINEDGIKANDGKEIYLVDHAWTFRPQTARQHLETIAGLLERMVGLFDLAQDESSSTSSPDEKEELIDKVMDEKWKYCSSYSLGSADTIEERMPIFYVLDEFGHRINHQDHGYNFRLVPFVYVPEGCAYSLLFPIKDALFEDEVTRDYLEGPEAAQDDEMRKALLNIWSKHDMQYIDWKQVEPEMDFFTSSRTNETVVEDPDFQAECLPTNRKIKVFTQYENIARNLSHSRFEIVATEEEADIVWLTHHFKQFKELAAESPMKRINQFPFEHVFTIKDLLCIVCRRMRQGDHNDPEWLPTTFNMKTELCKFVSHFQYREDQGLDNHWIVKPWNLARGLDMHVSKSLSQILKHSLAGVPKIVQKYLHHPVLFERPEIGKVKFDIRYILLLRSIKPLKVYAYNRFWLRLANEKFELNKYDVYEKHFTVMNYNEAPLEKLLCEDFIAKFENQHPEHNWNDQVQKKIFKMFRQVFEGACALEPPQGIAHNSQSRAMYACDLMLNWEDQGQMVPKILEINWGPDCDRACDYYPEFFNDIFSTLYLDEPVNVTLL